MLINKSNNEVKRQSEIKVIDIYNEVSTNNFKKLYFMILIRWMACNRMPRFFQFKIKKNYER